jgi:hypothetical protein
MVRGLIGLGEFRVLAGSGDRILPRAALDAVLSGGVFSKLQDRSFS